MPFDLKRHSAGEGRHVAIVDHFQRDTPFLAQPQEQRLDARREQIGGHGSKEGSDHDLVVDVNAGGAAADRVHPRQMARRQAQSFVDPPEVKLRIRLILRIPGDFGGKDRLTFLDRRQFVIAGAEVEADATTVQMPAQCHRTLSRLGHLLDRHGLHFERALIHPFHQGHIKCPRPTRAIRSRQRLAQLARTAHDHPPAPHLPE